VNACSKATLYAQLGLRSLITRSAQQADDADSDDFPRTADD
jgi:hypothetical protein